MKQVGYQGYAQGRGFDPIKVSDANVSRIAQEGQRVLKGMQMVADQDLQNQRAQLNQIQRNQQLEQRGREQRQQTRAQIIRDKQSASRRDYEIQSGNLQRAAQDKQELFKGLSQFSQTATKIATDMEQRWFEEESDKQYWDDVWNSVQYGVDPEEQLADRESYHKLNQMGEAIEIQADMAQAAGADPIQVDYFRGLNRAQRHGRKRAMIERAGMDASAYLEDSFLRDTTTELEVMGEDGQMITITPSTAVTSAQKAAFMPVLLKQYMTDRGLGGMKQAMLEPFYVKYRTAMESNLAATRKAELEAHATERLNTAQDALYDSFSVDRAMNYYNTLRRSSGMSHEQARKSLLEHIYTTVDENGNMRYSESEIDSLLDSAFPDQPTKSLRDRYSADVAKYSRDRQEALNKQHGLNEKAQQRQWDEYNDDLRNYLNDPNTQINNAMLEPLIEKAKREGNQGAVTLLTQYQSDFSEEGINDKYYENLWSEKAVMGLLTVEEVRTADVSTKLKGQYLSKAQESEANAMPKELKDSMEKQIESALSARIGQYNTTNIKDPTYHRALYAAKAQMMRDYQLAILKQGATPGEAEAYAMGRFQKEFDKEKGSYSISNVDPKSDKRRLFFNKYTVAPTDQASHPMTFAREAIKANPNAIASEPLLDRGELQRISQAVKAGKAFKIPESAQYLANMLNGVSVSDVLNAQMKHYGLDQIPLKAYERTVTSVDPEYQRLLTYTPNRTRVEIAGYGSGQIPGIAARRVKGAVNTPAQIMQTWIAAGGDPQKAALMTAIAMAESSGRQDAARSDTDVHGWFQVRYPVHVDKLTKLGITSRAQLLDPSNNTKAAMAILNSQGLGAWEAYTNGAYKQYLPQAEAAMRSFGSTPWRQGSTMNPRVVEYLTGDTSHPSFRADHGGSNYHEHVGFRTREDRDAAVAKLRAAGIKIGSLNDGVHSERSLHYEDRAVDLPMPFHIKPGSREERAYSARVRAILGIQ